jgi:hypothetical protein
VEITGPVANLLDMALRTFFFCRTRPDTGVTSRTLLMEGVRFGRQNRIRNLIGLVAVQAKFRFRGVIGLVLGMAIAASNERGVVIDGMMMTIVTGNLVSHIMLGMLKQNASGGIAKLDPDGVIRGFGRKGGVTEKTYNEENDGHAVDQLQISL